MGGGLGCFGKVRKLVYFFLQHPLGKPSWKKSSLSVDIVHTCPDPPPWVYRHQTPTFNFLFGTENAVVCVSFAVMWSCFLPSYTPGNAYREVYTMVFSSINHQVLKYAWYLGTSVKCFSTKYIFLVISTHIQKSPPKGTELVRHLWFPHTNSGCLLCTLVKATI